MLKVERKLSASTEHGVEFSYIEEILNINYSELHAFDP